jgi:2-dehydro-3-deoxy-D-gluconate 5-dehydrogenase
MKKLSVKQMFDLSGQAAIVTGGGMGIGQGIALRLAEAGAGVMVADIDLEAARQTADEITNNGGKAHVVQADVSRVADAEATVERTIDVFGRLDILVNNAGVCPFSPVMDITEEVWDGVHRVNLKGLFFFSKAAAGEMINAGRGGRIVNIASIDCLHPTGSLTAYDASKGGVLMTTRAMARELGQHRILVNAVAPGGIVTPMTKAVFANYENPEEAMKAVAEKVPLGRWGQPDDIARAVLFLSSPAADFITGSLLVVDGGILQV